MSKKTVRNDRQARIDEMRRQQAAAERRRTMLIVGPVITLILVLIVIVGVVIVREQQRQSDIDAAAEAPISGVQSFDKLTQNHVEATVNYPQKPPVGGDHNPVWQNCGVYDKPLINEHAVHALEHGAVWITYQPTLAQAEIDKLKALGEANEYALVSPYEGQASPVTLTAWGKQLAVPDAGDSRIEPFLRAYLQGEQTPEPGAACTGGFDGTAG